MRIILLSLCLLASFKAISQDSPTLAQRLGYPAGTKLLIIHADDLAVAYSQNQASISALDQGPVNSASIMVPCPWLTQIAAYAKSTKGQHDLGLHLTLTSEWKLYKWGPSAPIDMVSSLIDSSGHFYNECEVMAAHAKPKEVEKELRAQIERAKAVGIQPTHLDSHMGCLYWTNLSLFKIFLELGREYHLPVRISRDLLAGLPEPFQQAVTAKEVVIDHIVTANPGDYKQGMPQFYENAIRNLQPGVTEFVIHLAYDDVEMQAITMDHPEWGATWRQADFDFFSSTSCQKILAEENVQLITWKEIGKLLQR